MTREWRTVALRDVAIIERDVVEATAIDDGTLYVGLENIRSGGDFLNVRAVESGELASSKFSFTSRHLLYGKLRPYLAKIARPAFEGICSTDILPVLPGADLDRDFLAHFLLRPESVALANSRATGANLPRLSPRALADIRISFPPLAEQRRIAEVLDRADALRAKRREALAHLDTLAQAIFIDMFGDPTTNPNGWPMEAFGTVGRARLGKMLDQKKQTGDSRRRYLRNANVQWFRFALDDVHEMDFNDREREIFRLVPGDLLICEGGEPGRAAVWRGEIEECYYQKALHRIRPHPDLAVAEYLAWLLWFLADRGRLGDHITSATIAHLTGEKLEAMPIPVPPLELQMLFRSRLDAIEAVRVRYQSSDAAISALIESLQHRAFRDGL